MCLDPVEAGDWAAEISHSKEKTGKAGLMQGQPSLISSPGSSQITTTTSGILLLHSFCKKTAWSAEWDELYKQKCHVHPSRRSFRGNRTLQSPFFRPRVQTTQINQISKGGAGLKTSPARNNDKVMACSSPSQGPHSHAFPCIL